jgi:hypothetical protein
MAIVTGGRARVDEARDRGAWLLPGTDGTGGARLGRDTVAAAAEPPAFRPGAGAILGESLLASDCIDPAAVIGRNAASVTVRIEAGDACERLEPIVDRLLGTLVPAHCRLSVIWGEAGAADAGGPGGAGRLDGGIRLGGPAGDDGDGARLGQARRHRLGRTTRAARWRLPAGPHPPLDGPRRLDEIRLL